MVEMLLAFRSCRQLRLPKSVQIAVGIDGSRCFPNVDGCFCGMTGMEVYNVSGVGCLDVDKSDAMLLGHWMWLCTNFDFERARIE